MSGIITIKPSIDGYDMYDTDLLLCMITSLGLECRSNNVCIMSSNILFQTHQYLYHTILVLMPYYDTDINGFIPMILLLFDTVLLLCSCLGILYIVAM